MLNAVVPDAPHDVDMLGLGRSGHNRITEQIKYLVLINLPFEKRWGAACEVSPVQTSAAEAAPLIKQISQ